MTESQGKVQAAQLSASMMYAAQALAALPAGQLPAALPETAVVKSAVCGNGTVISYVSSKAPGLNRGAVPEALATRIAAQVKGLASARTNIVVATDQVAQGFLAGCPGAADAAQNTPVVQVSVAPQADLSADEELVEVRSATCTGGKIGTVLTSVFKNRKTGQERLVSGNPDDSCFEPRNAQAVSEFQITTGTMPIPDWRARLEDHNPGAMRNVTCIQRTGSEVCEQVNVDNSFKEKVDCTDNPDPEQTERLLVNPAIDPQTGKMAVTPDNWPQPSSGMYECGHGWKGELIARVQRKACTIKNSDGPGRNPVPATLFDIAYVGAKCTKAAVVIRDACPAGDQYLPNGEMTQALRVEMTAPIALVPQRSGGQNISRMAFSGADGSNVNDVTSKVMSGTQKIHRAQGVTADNLFASRTAIAGEGQDFDQNFVAELEAQNKLRHTGDKKCYTRGQTCAIDTPPVALTTLVQRSDDMNALLGQRVVMGKTVCKASFANLFEPSQRDAACVAAKGWKTVASEFSLFETVAQTIDANRDDDRTDSIRKAKDIALAYATDQAKAQMQDFRTIMVNALKHPQFANKLDNALAQRQDCGSGIQPDEYYGSCAPRFSEKDELKTCQTSCPGTCVTERLDSAVSEEVKTKIDVIDTYVRNDMVPRLPTDTRFSYLQVVNDTVPPPIVADLSTNVDDGQQPDRDNMIRRVLKKLEPAQKIEASGQAKIFRGIDQAIEQLIKDADLERFPNNTAHLVIFGGINDQEKIDRRDWWGMFWDKSFNRKRDLLTKDYQSPYFGRNICSPEPIPSGYACKFCTNVGFDKNGNKFCVDGWMPLHGFGRVKHVDINPNELKEINTAAPQLPKIMDTPGTRAQWCKDLRAQEKCLDRGWTGICKFKLDDDWVLADVEKRYDGTPLHGMSGIDNYDSLVGFFARHFPNVKVSWFDAGTGLSEGGEEVKMRDMCADKPLNVATTPTDFAPTGYEGHIFSGNRPIITVRDFGENLGKELNSFIAEATGSTGNSDQAGAEVCRIKYGADVQLIFGAPPGVPLNKDDSASSFSASCGTPEDVIPPKDYDAPETVINPVNIPPVYSPPPNNSDGCVNGINSYTLQPCSGGTTLPEGDDPDDDQPSADCMQRGGQYCNQQ